MEEIWKDIAGFDRYQVSNHGRISSRYGRNGQGVLEVPRIMALYYSKRGDRRIQLYPSDGGKRKKFLVHVLVAQEFIGPKPEGLETNHIDGNPWNNRVDNLEYVSKSGNVRHAFMTGIHDIPRGSKQHCAKLTESDVLAIVELKKTMRQSEIARMYGVKDCTLSDIFHGRTWNQVTGIPYNRPRNKTDINKWEPLRKRVFVKPVQKELS